MAQAMKGPVPSEFTGGETPAPPPAQPSRAEFDARLEAQRARNASAIVRAQQKVARERRMPVRHPK
jgi:hypothetical protein